MNSISIKIKRSLIKHFWEAEDRIAKDHFLNKTHYFISELKLKPFLLYSNIL